MLSLFAAICKLQTGDIALGKLDISAFKEGDRVLVGKEDFLVFHGVIHEYAAGVT